MMKSGRSARTSSETLASASLATPKSPITAKRVTASPAGIFATGERDEFGGAAEATDESSTCDRTPRAGSSAALERQAPHAKSSAEAASLTGEPGLSTLMALAGVAFSTSLARRLLALSCVTLACVSLSPELAAEEAAAPLPEGSEGSHSTEAVEAPGSTKKEQKKKKKHKRDGQSGGAASASD